ncbi:hypothetical protein [Fusobacterium animalis]|uniref:Uncharacterized protein n=1 Tax=Fusobacterium animalis TaxID=76859 RepID=A0A0M4RMC8_9FUSO|nr:hypothetical protein [Fusobacterium animalis]ALF18878.1 hypothetical protein RN98_04570 [Fusobacterium animalis]
MVIKKIMFENEVLEVGEINEKYNPTAVKGIEGIRPLWTLWISMILWFTQNPESFLITFIDGKQLKLINSKNVMLEDDFAKEQGNMIMSIIFTTILLLAIYWIIQTLTYRNSYYY